MRRGGGDDDSSGGKSKMTGKEPIVEGYLEAGIEEKDVVMKEESKEIGGGAEKEEKGVEEDMPVGWGCWI